MASNRWFGFHLGRAAIGIVAVVALVAAGCADDGDQAGDTTTTETTTTTTSSTTATSAAPATATTTVTTTSTSSIPTGETVEVFFSTGDGSDCGQVDSFPRALPAGADGLEFALVELVAGPTAAETEAGAGSFFSSDTADAIASVNLVDGLLIVDFIDLRPLLPNASSSCGSESLLAQLDATVFAFGDVDRARYRIEGSCDDFANWLQRECFDTDRDGNRLDVPTDERATGSGCTPPDGDGLPDGRWFGFVDQPEADQLAFDLACWFTGTAAAAAAAEDGEESPPPNDFHIRNEFDLLRTLTVGPGAQVEWLPDPGDPASAEPVAYDVWLAQQADRDPVPGVWLEIEGGQIVGIAEQYVP